MAKNIPGVKRNPLLHDLRPELPHPHEVFENVGMLSTEPVEFEGHKIVPIQFLKALLPDPATLGPRTVGKTNIGCIFTGKKGRPGEKGLTIYNVCDHQECYKEVGSQAFPTPPACPPWWAP